MAKNPNDQPAKRKEYDEIAGIIAPICGVTDRYVRMVRDGDAENERVLTAYMVYQEGKSELIKQIEQLVPFIN